MPTIIKSLVWGGMFAVSCVLQAQDAQFTQFYATPLYLNPSFAGSTGQARGVVAYRNQWAQLDAHFVTALASYDHYLEKYKIGFGILAINDQQGTNNAATLRNSEISAVGTYYVALNKKSQISFGLQAGITSRDLSYSNLLFSQQFNTLTNSFDRNRPSGEGFSGERITFTDFSTGSVFYTDNLWLGVAAHHITQPNQSFIGTADRLPLKGSLHGGYVFSLQNKKGYKPLPPRYLIPVFNYKFQGQSDQMSVGIYTILQPVLAGVWYRGLPFKRYERTFINQDAVSFCFGYQAGALKFAYSYDITISELARYGASSHEVTITYQLEVNHAYGKEGAKNIIKNAIPSPWQLLAPSRGW